jgi:IS4 transposase
MLGFPVVPNGVILFSAILERFMQASPIPVMVRAVLERVLTAERLERVFETATEKQYTKDLLFSSVFELMSLVVTKAFPSVHSAYQAKKEHLNIAVSIASVYNKLNGLDTDVSMALVHHTGEEFAAQIKEMNACCEPLLPGYRVKMLDGNCLAATEHRLGVLRKEGAGALPGKSLVVYDPALEMAIDVFPCEDGHAQERSILDQVLSVIEANDVILEDRNFCVRSHLLGIERKGAYFITRHHKQMPYKDVGELEKVGDTDTGEVYEQRIEVADEQGQLTQWRKIIVKLYKETRDKDKEIVILTNLPSSVADGIKVASLYRSRWSIEGAFQNLEAHLNSEIKTLGYPRAGLFGFCIALVAYNIMAVVKAALRHVHGEEKIRNEVSGYYIAGEIARTHTGMEVAINVEEWAVFRTLPQSEFIATLIQLAKNVNLRLYKKHPRGIKKTPVERKSSKCQPHVSTAKLLRDKKNV